MKSYGYQKGVGLIEVLVALFLLAIGVLGYVALQLRAVDASSEALKRSQAIMVMRGLTESMRANGGGQSLYPVAVQGYVAITAATAAPTTCKNSACTAQQMANYDAYMAAKAALDNGISMTMTTCPGVTTLAPVKRQCMFAAWGATTLSATNYFKCMGTDGVYVSQSQCVMMEAY